MDGTGKKKGLRWRQDRQIGPKNIQKELMPFTTSRTTPHFPAENPLPATFVRKIVRAGITENETSAKS